MVVPKKSVEKAAPKAVALRPPGESSNPAVHQLMAERYTASQNGDQAGIAAATKKLNDLGYA